MSETLTGCLEQVSPGIVDRVAENLQTALTNTETLKVVLGQEHPLNRLVQIESVSSSLDIGGFFMDEESSDPRYRRQMFRGTDGGDAVEGIVHGLVAREKEDGKHLQIQIDVGTFDDPILCFFEFQKTIEGCTINSYI